MRCAERILLAIGATVASLVSCDFAFAYCAVCRTALLNSPEGQKLASGFDNGILFLLGAPFVVIGVTAFLIFKAQRASRSGDPLAGDSQDPALGSMPGRSL